MGVSNRKVPFFRPAVEEGWVKRKRKKAVLSEQPERNVGS
jgi:hypothetical protein